MASPDVTLSGTLQDVSGNANAGTVVITLVNFGDNPPLVSGTALFAPISITVKAASNGTWSTSLWGNDQISPSNTFYQVQVISAGAIIPAWSAGYVFDSGTYDLSTQTPVIIYPAPVPPYVPNAIAAQTAPAGDYFSGINSSGRFSYSNPLGAIIRADVQSGANWGAKIAAAIALLPAFFGPALRCASPFWDLCRDPSATTRRVY
jgi:hypothetical protein